MLKATTKKKKKKLAQVGFDLGTQTLKTTVKIIRDSPQQTPGSVDCGIIVCEVMKHIFEHSKIRTSCDAVQGRADLVHQLLNTPGRSWTQDAYDAMKVARSFLFKP